MPAMVSFFVSAFWHGFYPFYYGMFMMAAVMVECTKDVFKSRVFVRFLPGFVKHILGNFMSMLLLNYLGIVFTSLTFENGLKFLGATRYFTYIGMIGFLIFSRSIGLVGRAKKLEKRLAE